MGSRHLRRAHGITLAEYERLVEQQRGGEADGQLPDGTSYFGRLGELGYDPVDDRAQCHLCGAWLKWVGGLHLIYRQPGWTIDRYRAAFALTGAQSTMAASSRARLRALTIQRLRGRAARDAAG